MTGKQRTPLELTFPALSFVSLLQSWAHSPLLVRFLTTRLPSPLQTRLFSLATGHSSLDRTLPPQQVSRLIFSLVNCKETEVTSLCTAPTTTSLVAQPPLLSTSSKNINTTTSTSTLRNWIFSAANAHSSTPYFICYSLYYHRITHLSSAV